MGQNKEDVVNAKKFIEQGILWSRDDRGAWNSTTELTCGRQAVSFLQESGIRVSAEEEIGN